MADEGLTTIFDSLNSFAFPLRHRDSRLQLATVLDAQTRLAVPSKTSCECAGATSRIKTAATQTPKRIIRDLLSGFCENHLSIGRAGIGCDPLLNLATEDRRSIYAYNMTAILVECDKQLHPSTANGICKPPAGISTKLQRNRALSVGV
jgi:hypothetical protein